MGMRFAPTWLRQVSPPASQNLFNHWTQRVGQRIALVSRWTRVISDSIC